MLANQPGVIVTVVDRTNHHLFQPLLYQVAIAGLEAPAIAEPARALLRDYPNIRFRIGAINCVDLDRNIVSVDDRRLRYDYLVIATGSRTAHFNIHGIQEYAYEMKTLNQALTIRDQILSACEEATRERDPDRRAALLTFVIVGGGATGVELAGALAELRTHVLERDYPEIRPEEFRIVVVESSGVPLATMNRRLSEYTLRTLKERFQVRFIGGVRVTEIRRDGVLTSDDRHLRAYTVIWTAGVTGNLFPGLPEPTGSGRLVTDEALRLADHLNVYVVGDVNGGINPKTGEPYPRLGQTAVQQGRHAGRNIRLALADRPAEPFEYRDKGVLVTIGRNRGVADLHGLQFTGLPAWIAWLGVHLMLLVGFRNKVLVLTSWIYSYVTYDFAVRILRQRRPFPG